MLLKRHRICGMVSTSFVWRYVVLSKEQKRWRNLCEQAAKEQDVDRLLQLVRRINRMLVKRLLQAKKLPDNRSSGNVQ